MLMDDESPSALPPPALAAWLTMAYRGSQVLIAVSLVEATLA
jgi:hypothetical protein